MVDVLSAVLSLVHARGSVSGRLRAGGDWALILPAPENPKFNVVVKGQCWLSTDALEAPVSLSEGDGFLLVDSVPYTLSSSPDLPPTKARGVFEAAIDGVATIGSGEGTFLVGGQIELDAITGPFLLEPLPPVLIVRADAAGSTDLHWALQALVRELESDSPGQSLLSEHLAQLVVILILRGYYASGETQLAGWLTALADPRLARAIGAVHRDPSRTWTVGELAGEAGMSRSSFAELFKSRVGRTPMAYAADWRLQLAASRLTTDSLSMASIAAASGYGSESALGAAFRRRFGTSPARYRREAREAAATRR